MTTATAEPKTSVVDEALARAEGWKAQEAADAAESERSAWDHYIAILLRSDAPESNDVNELASLLAILVIDRERFEEDRRIIAKALKLQELHGQQASANKARVEAYDAYRQMERQHKEEEHRLFMARHRAESHSNGCSEADYLLTKLRRQRPQLFAEGEPVALRAEAKSSKPKVGKR